MDLKTLFQVVDGVKRLKVALKHLHVEFLLLKLGGRPSS